MRHFLSLQFRFGLRSFLVRDIDEDAVESTRCSAISGMRPRMNTNPALLPIRMDYPDIFDGGPTIIQHAPKGLYCRSAVFRMHCRQEALTGERRVIPHSQ